VKPGKLVIAAACMVVAALPVLAHHELRAEFDEHKPVTLRGIVTRFDWNNPLALLYVDVRDNGGEPVNWAVEWASPLDLRKAGWTRDVLKVGDSVTVEGWLARDGSKLASGRILFLTLVRLLYLAPFLCNVRLKYMSLLKLTTEVIRQRVYWSSIQIPG